MPLNTSTGSIWDMPPLLHFHFWDSALFNTEDASFTSDVPEERESFVGISKNVGHEMTFKIINISTNKIVNRSNVRPSNDDKHHNLRADAIASPKLIKLLQEDNFKDEDSTSRTPTKDSSSTFSSTRPMPAVDPQDLVGRTFLLNKEGNQRLRACIVKPIDYFEGDLTRFSSRLKFVCIMSDDAIEETFTCNELLYHINNSEEDDIIEWEFRETKSHEGPLPRTHPNFNRSPCSLTIV